METIYVQFSDSSENVIIALFGSPQSIEYYPYQGEVNESDPRYAIFWNSIPVEYQVMWPTPSST